MGVREMCAALSDSANTLHSLLPFSQFLSTPLLLISRPPHPHTHTPPPPVQPNTKGAGLESAEARAERLAAEAELAQALEEEEDF